MAGGVGLERAAKIGGDLEIERLQSPPPCPLLLRQRDRLRRRKTRARRHIILRTGAHTEPDCRRRCRFGKRGSPTEKLNAPARQEDPVFDLVLPSLASEHQRFGGSRVIDPLQLVAARQPPVPVAVQFQSLAVIRRLAPVHTRCPASPTSNSGRVRPRGCGLCLLRFGIRFRGGVLRRQRKAPGGQRAQQK